MLAHSISLHAAVHLIPLNMHVHSDGRHARVHLHEIRSMTISGAGEVVIQLIMRDPS